MSKNFLKKILTTYFIYVTMMPQTKLCVKHMEYIELTLILIFKKSLPTSQRGKNSFIRYEFDKKFK